MPTLLFINVAINWGSTGKIVEGIGSLAASNGWDVFIAHGARYRNPSSHKDIQITSKAGELLHFIESSVFDAQGLGSRYATRRFLNKLDEIKPDLVHIHNIHGCYLNYPLLFQYLRNHRIPIIWTLHDCWAMTGHCVHFCRTNCIRWQSQCFRCPQLRDFPPSYLFDKSKRNYLLKKRLFTSIELMRITTVSSWLKGTAQQSFLGCFPILVVPNGINTSLFKPTKSVIREQLDLKNKKVVLGVASGFGDRKGLHDYILLASLLSSEYKIVLVGVSKSDKKSLPESIIAIDRADGPAELSAYYTTADVLLSLSYEETFGLTIIEAMACGTPAIVYDNTAQPELITAKTGRVVPNGDVESVVRSIYDLCSRNKSYYSSECRSRAELFDERRVYQRYLDLYNTDSTNRLIQNQ